MSDRRPPALQVGDLTASAPIIQGGMGVGVSLSGLASAIAATLGVVLIVQPSAAQTTPPPAVARPTAVRAVLANSGLPNVVDAPLHFKLLRVSIPAGQSAASTGGDGFVFQISGVLAVVSEAGRRILREGEAVFVGSGKSTTLRAEGGGPAVFLYFLLLRAGDLDKAAERAPVTITELYRTAAPIPGLKPGPYEFSLIRATLPPRLPINPPHQRSGAALYYIASGTGYITAGGRTEPRPPGSIQYEPPDLVHQWANPGETPLVLLQANLSQEGVPAVIFVPGTPPATPR